MQMLDFGYLRCYTDNVDGVAISVHCYRKELNLFNENSRYRFNSYRCIVGGL